MYLLAAEMSNGIMHEGDHYLQIKHAWLKWLVEDKEEVNETTVQYGGVILDPLKARVSCSSRQEPSVTTGGSLFSPLPPAFAVVPQYLLHIPVDLLSLSRTGQAAFPYIRLFGGSFSVPPLYDTGSGLCGAWV